MNVSHESILGCIVGGAIGDALGGLGERGQLSISDDTQLTIATCEAIAKVGQVSPEAVAECFLRWFRARAITGLGSSTLKSLRDLDAGAHWALCGAKGERAAGNGAAMRIAPLAFVLDSRDTSHRVTIRDVCRITHHHDEAYLGALAVLLAIQCPVWLPPLPPPFSFLADALPDSCVRDRLIAYSELPANEPLSSVVARFGSSGYVVETVPLAILLAARLTTETFGPALAELVSLADDADTIGSIAGQIAGAHLGYSQLPQHLLEMPAVQWVVPFAEAVAGKLGPSNTKPEAAIAAFFRWSRAFFRNLVPAGYNSFLNRPDLHALLPATNPEISCACPCPPRITRCDRTRRPPGRWINPTSDQPST